MHLSCADLPLTLITTLGSRHVFIPMLQMKKQKLSEIQSSAHSHAVSEWLSRDSECDSRVPFLPSYLGAQESNDPIWLMGKLKRSSNLLKVTLALVTEPTSGIGFTLDSTHPNTRTGFLPAGNSSPTIGYSLSSLKYLGFYEVGTGQEPLSLDKPELTGGNMPCMCLPVGSWSLGTSWLQGN